MENFWCFFGLHKYSQWKDISTIEIYSAFLSSKHPSEIKMVQGKRCKNCNKLKTREVNYV